MKWEPSEALVAWGNEHFGKMPVGSVWAPDDSGVQYQKLSQTSYLLIFLRNDALAQEHHEKFTILMKVVVMRLSPKPMAGDGGFEPPSPAPKAGRISRLP